MGLFDNITDGDKWEMIFGGQVLDGFVLDRVILQGNTARFYLCSSLHDVDIPERWVVKGYNVVEFDLFVVGIETVDLKVVSFTGGVSFEVIGQAPNKKIIFKINEGSILIESKNVFLGDVSGVVYDS